MKTVQEGICGKIPNVRKYSNDDNGSPRPAKIDQALRKTVVEGQKSPLYSPDTSREEVRIYLDVFGVVIQHMPIVFRLWFVEDRHLLRCKRRGFGHLQDDV